MARFQKGDIVFLKEDFAGHREGSCYEILEVYECAGDTAYFISDDEIDECFDVDVPESKLLSVEEYRLKLEGKRTVFADAVKQYARQLSERTDVAFVDIDVKFPKHWWEQTNQ